MTNQEIKSELLRRLQSTGREGMENTIAYLNGSDYFTVGCNRHHRYPGGLAKHSLEVCDYALAHRGTLPENSIIIVSLLHDICTAYTSVARHIYRHGHRSVRILKEICHLQLTKEEYEAILYHMHPEASVMKANPLARLVCQADKASARGCCH